MLAKTMKFLAPVAAIEGMAAVLYAWGAHLWATAPHYVQMTSVCMYFSCAGDPQQVIFGRIWEAAGWCVGLLGGVLLLLFAVAALAKRVSRA